MKAAALPVCESVSYAVAVEVLIEVHSTTYSLHGNYSLSLPDPETAIYDIFSC